MEPQQTLDEIFGRLKAGRITRKQYVGEVDAAFRRFPTETLSRLRYRRDDRSPGRFALGLHDNTLRERVLFEACWPRFAKPGESYEDLGLDNEGRLIIAGNGGGRPQLDFLVRGPDYSHPVEVKYAPAQRFLTFKVADLVNYTETPDARMLVVATPSSMAGGNGNPESSPEIILPYGTWFMMMDHAAMRRLLDVGEYDTHKGFGGKPTVRLYHRQFRSVCQPVPL